MPERQIAQAASAVPFAVMVVAAMLFGVTAQIGVTLALGIARSRAQFLGFCLLSLVFSGAASILLSEVAHMKPPVAAAIAAAIGAIPSLITLRVGLRAVAERYHIPLNPKDTAELEGGKADE